MGAGCQRHETSCSGSMRSMSTLGCRYRRGAGQMQPFGCARRAGPRGDTAVLASCATPRCRLERIAMSAPRDFQSLLLALQTYWAERGCALLQGYDLEVGAGTMNPATFLRVLGPEAWNVAYGEPSRRPAECRRVSAELTYGLERMAMYLQGVDNIYDLRWVGDLTYGEVFHQNEVEQSKYSFQASDPQLLFQLFQSYEKECDRLLRLELPLP